MYPVHQTPLAVILIRLFTINHYETVQQQSHEYALRTHCIRTYAFELCVCLEQ